MGVDLTERDLSEAIAIVAAERLHHPHQAPEMRHVIALADWAGAMEQAAWESSARVDWYALRGATARVVLDDGIVCTTEEAGS